ncbi:hypothetical protein U1Q18_018998 [Sarracenia purpurea var. burkii]
MKNKAAVIHKAAEEKRALIEAKRDEDLHKAEEIAAKYRATGTSPKKLLGREAWWLFTAEVEKVGSRVDDGDVTAKGAAPGGPYIGFSPSGLPRKKESKLGLSVGIAPRGLELGGGGWWSWGGVCWQRRSYCGGQHRTG